MHRPVFSIVGSPYIKNISADCNLDSVDAGGNPKWDTILEFKYQQLLNKKGLQSRQLDMEVATGLASWNRRMGKCCIS